MSEEGAKPASAPTPAPRLPFTDGLGPILLGLLWLLPALTSANLFPFLVSSAATYEVDPSSRFFLLTLDQTRAATLSTVALPIILFAGLGRAALPYLASREGLALRFVGRLAFWLLAAALMGWMALTLSFTLPGLWPEPIQMRPVPPEMRAFTDAETMPVQITPRELYRADFVLIAMVYAAFMLFAAQILATLALNWRGARGPAALALAIAAGLALTALPDDLRHQWIDLQEKLALSTPGPEAGPLLEEGPDAEAAPRRDGLFYIFDQIAMTALDFVLIAAVWAVLSAAALKAEAGVQRWGWLGHLAVAIYGAGAALALMNIGFEDEGAMLFWLRIAAAACAAPLLLLPVAWIAALWPKGARRGVPAYWALGAALPSAAVLAAPPLIAGVSESPLTALGFWVAIFDLRTGVWLAVAGFAGWYAFQHAMTGRETARFWSVAHLTLVLIMTPLAVALAFVADHLIAAATQAGLAGAECLEVGLYDWSGAAWSGPCRNFKLLIALLLGAYFFGEWILFALGLALARTRHWSRFDPTPSAALAPSAPPMSFEKKGLFDASSDESAPHAPEQSQTVDAPTSDDAPTDPEVNGTQQG